MEIFKNTNKQGWKGVVSFVGLLISLFGCIGLYDGRYVNMSPETWSWFTHFLDWMWVIPAIFAIFFGTWVVKNWGDKQSK